jgi:hypothetical protein
LSCQPQQNDDDMAEAGNTTEGIAVSHDQKIPRNARR